MAREGAGVEVGDIENGKVEGVAEQSFCSYIRRALISKSEGCSRTVTTLHQIRSVTAKRVVRRLPDLLGVSRRPVSERSRLSDPSLKYLTTSNDPLPLYALITSTFSF